MANLKNTTVQDSLQIASGTTDQRPDVPLAGMTRYNTNVERIEYYNGTAWLPLSDTHPQATGGQISDINVAGDLYRVHYFTNPANSTFTVTHPGTVEYLIVAGGGSGGGGMGGGGGAGGLLSGTLTVTPQDYSITVGAGGEGILGGTGRSGFSGNKGLDSTAFGITAVGGGYGGRHREDDISGTDGGSGGGSGAQGSAFRPGGQGTSGQGFAGGSRNGSASPNYGAGGGGGASQQGSDVINSQQKGGDGGQGLYTLITGKGTWFAGGGGGCAYTDLEGAGNGGQGGGGGGSCNTGTRGNGGLGLTTGQNGSTGSSQDGGAAGVNTGGGGGGASWDASTGGNGGTGIVIIRYRRNTTSTPIGNEVVVQDGLVLHLDAVNTESYSNNSNLWRDLSGEHNSAVINGVEVNTTGARFDTQGDNINIKSNSLRLPLSKTLSFWVRSNRPLSANDNWQIGFLDNNSTSGAMFGFMYGVGPCQDLGYWGNGSANDASVESNTNKWSSDGLWHNAVLTMNSSRQVNGYIDGVQIQFFKHNTNSLVNFLTMPVDTANYFTISSRGSWPGRFNYLDLDNVLVYNRELSETEVVQNYNAHRGRYGL